MFGPNTIDNDTGLILFLSGERHLIRTLPKQWSQYLHVWPHTQDDALDSAASDNGGLAVVLLNSYRIDVKW